MGQVGQILAAIPFTLFGFLPLALIVFAIWKFYQVLSKINDNLGEIKQAIAGIPARGPEESASS